MTENLPSFSAVDNIADRPTKSSSTSSSGLTDVGPSHTSTTAPTTQDGGSQRVVMRNRSGTATRRSERNSNGLNFSRPKSEYISPAGISALDIRTRLRITEAELAIVQRELSDLQLERNLLEASSRQYEESWRFALCNFGHVVEQRDELQKKYNSLEQAITEVRHNHPEVKGKKGAKVNKSSWDQLKLSLETQTRVAESLEHERDRAYDDYEMAQVQLHTLFQQYQDLASSCSEVARDRMKLKGDIQLLRDELHRCDPESDLSSSRGSLKKMDSATGSRASLSSVGMGSSGGGGSGGGGDSDENQVTDPQVLIQQLREVKEERDRGSSKYEQLMKRAEQFQKQLYRAEEDRRQALATSEALASLWQKKFDKAQNENYDLRQELLSAHERISLLQEHLAMVRLQSRRNTPQRPSPPNEDTSHSGRSSPVKSCLSHSAGSGSNLIASRTGGNQEGSVVDKGAGGVGPHRTSSFHNSGINKVSHNYSLSQTTPYVSSHNTSRQSHNGLPITRTGSLKSPQDLISPYNSSSHVRNGGGGGGGGSGQRFIHAKSMDEEMHTTTDEDGSWI